VGDLEGDSGLADAAGTHQCHQPRPAVQEAADLCRLLLAAHQFGQRPRELVDRRRSAGWFGTGQMFGPVAHQESLREDHREVVAQKSFQLVGVPEGPIADGVVLPHPVQQGLQPRFPICRSPQVHQPRKSRGEVVLVLESRDRFLRRDPPVALGVQADEDVALCQVGPVQRSGGVRTGAEFEHHRDQPQALHRPAGRHPLLGHLDQRGTDEDPRPLVRGEDAVGDLGAGSGTHASTPITCPNTRPVCPSTHPARQGW